MRPAELARRREAVAAGLRDHAQKPQLPHQSRRITAKETSSSITRISLAEAGSFDGHPRWRQ